MAVVFCGRVAVNDQAAHRLCGGVAAKKEPLPDRPRPGGGFPNEFQKCHPFTGGGWATRSSVLRERMSLSAAAQ